MPKSVRCTWANLSGFERGSPADASVARSSHYRDMLKPSLQLKLGQQLTMTPQLQQAIRLLQMPALELQAHVRELLESNIMLEAVDETEATGVFEALTPPTVESPATDRGADQDEALAEVEIVDDNWSDRSSSPTSCRSRH